MNFCIRMGREADIGSPQKMNLKNSLNFMAQMKQSC